MNHSTSELSEMKPLLEYYSTLKFLNSFLDYGIIILSQYNDKKLHESISTLDDLKENLINNPDNNVLKIKFQLKLNQLKSIISTRKRLELLNYEIKKLKHR
jgi:hypothetical protein